uniref:Ig-like domain-containing protein n=1 Tax=Canis lupus familiaris TaxID=9615 RepID=A0A8I3NNP1_CANLF
MMPPSQILRLLLCVPGERMSPKSPSAAGSVKASSHGQEALLSLYLHRPGQAKVLIYLPSTSVNGVPAWFSNSRSGTNFTLTIISSLQAKDNTTNYMSEPSLWLTFGQGTKVEIKRNDAQPAVYLFQPSPDQLHTGSASVVCLLNSFYPKDINVKWKVDGVIQDTGIQESVTEQDKDSTYSLSSTLTMSSTEYLSHELYSCEITHKSLPSTLIKSFQRSECQRVD